MNGKEATPRGGNRRGVNRSDDSIARRTELGGYVLGAVVVLMGFVSAVWWVVA